MLSVLGLGAAPAVLSSTGARAAAGALPGGNGRIAYVATANDVELFESAEDGSSVRRLTRRFRSDFDPAVSPDGRSVAFISNLSGNSELYVMELSSRVVRRLTRTPTRYERAPHWSPDGSHLVFERKVAGDEASQLHVIAAEGGAERQLTDGAHDAEPAWSPDGRWIAFRRGSPPAFCCNHEIYVVSADGAQERRLTTEQATGYFGAQPGWSADGRVVIYRRESRSQEAFVRVSLDGGPQEILRVFPAPGCDVPDCIDLRGPFVGADGRMAFVLNGDLNVLSPDGSRVRLLTTGGRAHPVGRVGWASPMSLIYARPVSGPSAIQVLEPDGSRFRRIVSDLSEHLVALEWSPDGRRLFFASAVPPGRTYVVNADGSRRRAIHGELPSARSPDGTLLLYARRQLYVRPVRGGAQRRLTSGGGRKSSPRWSPDSSFIVFLEHHGDVESTLRIVRANSTGRRALARGELGRGDWSPDGRRIVFTKNYEAYVIGRDGKGLRRLVREKQEWWEFDPVWSPDGRYVAFAGGHIDAGRQLYIVRSDGRGLRRLTNTRGDLYGPAWARRITPRAR